MPGRVRRAPPRARVHTAWFKLASGRSLGFWAEVSRIAKRRGIKSSDLKGVKRVIADVSRRLR
jgi:hypothetical protein